jgi:hypothetical protein
LCKNNFNVGLYTRTVRHRQRLTTFHFGDNHIGLGIGFFLFFKLDYIIATGGGRVLKKTEAIMIEIILGLCTATYRRNKKISLKWGNPKKILKSVKESGINMDDQISHCFCSTLPLRDIRLETFYILGEINSGENCRWGL